MKDLIVSADVDQLIYTIRDRRVMLDTDLARIYGVTTKRLNEQVGRNKERFPDDFMFRLTAVEVNALNRSQFATGSQKHRDPKFPPFAFTEHGAVMLSAVLRTPVAVAASISVVRAFNRLREIAKTHKDLTAALAALERQVGSQGSRLDDHAEKLGTLFTAIREIMEPPIAPPKEIGFSAKPRERK
jgi:hypothetical protein